MKRKRIIRPYKQEDDTMFLWDCVLLFDTEKNTLKPENVPTITKDPNLATKDDAIVSNIKKLQKTVRGQSKNDTEDEIPKVTIFSRETEQINKPLELMGGQVYVNKGNTEKTEEPEKEIPTKNHLVEEDVESIGEEKAKTPPFLLTLEILNHKVHSCLVDSGS